MLRTNSKKHAALLAAAALGGCGGVQSALDPAGPNAEALARLTWIMLAGGGTILGLVMLAACYAVYRDPDRRRGVSSTAMIVWGGIAFPVVVLSALLVYGVWLTGSLRAAPEDGALRVHVTGHMWWWEVRYWDSDAAGWVSTANELRIPVGRPVALSFSSHDVIHSFWVPSLAGKIDMIPGRHTELTLRAERAGSYRGQCAEFCGAQHALMAFHVVAVASEEFARWLEGLGAPARPPSGEQALLGRKAFLEQGCAACHTVRGLVEGKVPAPDLTHVGSRSWIGAGTLPNTREHMVAWLAHGESLKPGRAMPSYSHLEPATLAALAEYLAGLE
jgi:cytochrome c oxidase subunit 2